jgi:hypothetical protein
MTRRRGRRHHYHPALKTLVTSTTDEELKKYGITKKELEQKFDEMEKLIDSGEFYPERVQDVINDITNRVSEGKGPLSMKGINLIKDEIEERKYREKHNIYLKIK